MRSPVHFHSIHWTASAAAAENNAPISGYRQKLLDTAGDNVLTYCAVARKQYLSS